MTVTGRAAWANDIVTASRSAQRGAAATAQTTEQARVKLRGLIVEAGATFVDEIADIFAEAARAFRDERVSVVVKRDAATGGALLLAGDGAYLAVHLDGSAAKAPGLFVRQNTYGSGYSSYPAFACVDGALRVTIAGEPLAACDAARALAEPFLKTVCLHT